MPTLYRNAHSGNCHKVERIAALRGMPLELRDISFHTDTSAAERAEVAALSKIARVPTLVLDDGTVLSESNAILCYLADGTPWWPDEPLARAETLRWMFFEQNLHEPNVAGHRYQVHLAPQPEVAPAVLERMLRSGLQALQTMEDHLAQAEWFSAGRFGIADIALHAYTVLAPEGGFDLEPFPKLRAWLDRVAAELPS